jgi:hypothetical protein
MSEGLGEFFMPTDLAGVFTRIVWPSEFKIMLMKAGDNMRASGQFARMFLFRGFHRMGRIDERAGRNVATLKGGFDFVGVF